MNHYLQHSDDEMVFLSKTVMVELQNGKGNRTYGVENFVLSDRPFQLRTCW